MYTVFIPSSILFHQVGWNANQRETHAPGINPIDSTVGTQERSTITMNDRPWTMQQFAVRGKIVHFCQSVGVSAKDVALLSVFGRINAFAGHAAGPKDVRTQYMRLCTKFQVSTAIIADRAFWVTITSHHVGNRDLTSWDVRAYAFYHELWSIMKRMSEALGAREFYDTKQRVNKTRTQHFPWYFLFIIYTLRHLSFWHNCLFKQLENSTTGKIVMILQTVSVKMKYVFKITPNLNRETLSQQWKIVIRSLWLDDFLHVWKASLAVSHWLSLICVRKFTMWLFCEYVAVCI